MINGAFSPNQTVRSSEKAAIELHLAEGRSAEAFRAATAYCTANPNDPEGHRLLGKAAFATNDNAATASAYCNAIRLNPAQTNDIFRDAVILSIETGQAQQALDVAKLGVAAFPEDTVLDAYLRVVHYSIRNDFVNAQSLREALRQDPHQWGSFYATYVTAMTEHNLLQEAVTDLLLAEEVLERSIPFSHGRASALYHAAHVLYRLRQFDKLQPVLDKLHSIQPAISAEMTPLWEAVFQIGDGAFTAGDADDCKHVLANLLTGRASAKNLKPLGLKFLVGQRYRFFAIEHLDMDARQRLSEEGLSVSFLETLDKQGSAYVNAISPPTPGRAWRSDRFVSQRVRDVLDTLVVRQKTVLSPISGSVTTSTQMLASEVFLASDQGLPFIVAQWSETDLCMSDTVWIIPHLEMVIYIVSAGFSEKVVRQKLSDLYEHILANSEKFISHLSKPTEKFVVSQPEIPHIGHYIWNAISGLSSFFKYCPLDKYPDYIGVYDNIRMVGDVHDFYKDFCDGRTLPLKFENLHAANEYILENSAMLLTLKDRYITNDLASRVIRGAYDNVEPVFAERLRLFRSECYPIILVTLRLGNRAWIGQEEAWPKVLKRLVQDFPSLGVIIDGINRDVTQGWSHSMMSLHEEQAVAATILAACGDDLQIFNSIGCTVSESIVLSDIADGFVAPVGAGMAKYRWITNLPGVAFSNEEFSDPESMHGRLYDSYREYARKATHIAPEFIEDIGIDLLDRTRANFSMDWKILHEAVDIFLRDLGEVLPYKE